MIRIIFAVLISIPIFLTAQTNTQHSAAQSPVSSVQKALDQWVNAPSMQTASLAFLVQDVETGAVLASYRPTRSIIPASVQKLFTTATALEVLGRDKRFFTRLAYTGVVADSILQGDVIVIAGGDPSLGSSRFNTFYYAPHFLDTFAKALQKAGIKQIKGRLLADLSIYPKHTLPSTWAWEDIGNYWGARPTPLSVYDNTYLMLFDSPTGLHAKTTVVGTIPDSLGLDIENVVRTNASRSDNAYIYGAPYSNERYVEGTIPRNRKSFAVKGAMPNPGLTFLADFQKHLATNNILFTGTKELLFEPLTTSRTEVLSYPSPYLQDIVNKTNEISMNLYAEHLLRHIGIAKNGSADLYTAIDSEKKFWQTKGMNTDGLQLFDGSGLSHYNTMTAQQMVFLLRYMATQSAERLIFENSLPIAGKTGTLRHTGKGTACVGRVMAKTGSLNRVRTYAGYVNSVKGKKYAFFFAANNYTGTSSDIKEAFVELMLRVIEN